MLLSYIVYSFLDIKFDQNKAVKRNNYLTKIVNVYIVFDLDACPKSPTNNFKFKNCLFGASGDRE